MSDGRQIKGSGHGDRVVLCAASAYQEKYYFNDQFGALPEEVKRQLHILCVLFTEEIGGEFLIEFDPEGNLEFTTQARDSDYQYDEIGAALMIKEIRRTRGELLSSLELFYRVVMLGFSPEDA